MARRGDVVVAVFPYVGGGASKNRPAVVVAVKCENIVTIAQADILQTIGHLSDPLTQKLEECLKAALELS